MNVDNILHEKLNEYPLLSTLNKSFIMALIGKPGSGKSHFIISLLSIKVVYFKLDFFSMKFYFKKNLNFFLMKRARPISKNLK